MPTSNGIAALEQLQSLPLGNTKVTGVGLKRLAGLKQKQSLQQGWHDEPLAGRGGPPLVYAGPGRASRAVPVLLSVTGWSLLGCRPSTPPLLSVSGNLLTRLARSPTGLRPLSRQTSPPGSAILTLGNC